MTTTESPTKPAKKRATAMNSEAATALREMALVLCEGADGVARDRVLVKMYEAFLRGCAEGQYDYTYKAQEAARAILGLPVEDD